MFTERQLPPAVATVKESYAPNTLVLDAESDFETLPPAVAEDLGLLVESLDPVAYPDEWLPGDAPRQLRRFVGPDFTIGMPGDGTVIWTRQTQPPTVIAKRRAETTPDAFLAFLLAEAFVELGVEVPTAAIVGDTEHGSTDTGHGSTETGQGTTGRIPEHFLPFFGRTYRDLDDAIPLGPTDVYQVANALFDAWVGLQTRPVFAGWADDPALDRLGEAWTDAGERLTGRLEELPRRVARGQTDFADATEYACSAVKHGLDLPAPFSALDTTAYSEHGALYAVTWAEKTFEQLEFE